MRINWNLLPLTFLTLPIMGWTVCDPEAHTIITGNLILNTEDAHQAQITLQNNKDISQPGMASSFTADALEGSGAISMTNQGNISNQALGTFLNCGGLSGSDPKIWNWTLLNEGPVSGNVSVGVLSSIDGPFTMDDGQIILSNTASLWDGARGVIFASNGYTQTGGTFTLNKCPATATLASNTFGTQASIDGPMLITGGTYENNGLVLVSDTLVLQGAGVIKGSGIFAGLASFGSNLTPLNQFLNKGTMIVGNSPGITQIVGRNYTQESDGTLVIHILNASGPGPDGYSQLNVIGGSAHLAGTLEIVLDPGADVLCGNQFTILKASQGITGTFDIINAASLDWELCPELCYLPNSIILSFCDIFSLCPCISDYLGNFTQTIVTSITDTNNFFIKRELQRLQQRTEATTPKLPGNAYIGPLGSVGRSDRNGNQVGFNYWSAGALSGADYAFSKGGVGGLAIYESIHSYDVGSHWGNFQAQRAHASLYGTYLPMENKKFSIDAMLGGGYDWYQIHRNEGHLDKKGTPNGYELDGMLSLEYMLTKNDYHVIPMVNLQYIHLHVSKYFEEKNCISEFWFKSQNINSLSTILGLWGDKTWKYKHPFTAQVNVGWQREYLNHDRTLHYSAQNMELPGAARNNLLAGLNLLIHLKDRWSLEASYDLIWNHQLDRNSFYLGLNGGF